MIPHYFQDKVQLLSVVFVGSSVTGVKVLGFSFDSLLVCPILIYSHGTLIPRTVVHISVLLGMLLVFPLPE